MTLELV